MLEINTSWKRGVFLWKSIEIFGKGALHVLYYAHYVVILHFDKWIAGNKDMYRRYSKWKKPKEKLQH